MRQPLSRYRCKLPCMPISPASGVFALGMMGDLAGVTYVQKGNNNRKSYAKTYPKRGASPRQAPRRAAFRDAVHSWQALDQEHKAVLDAIARHFNMCASGYNVWISCTINHHPEWVVEWAAQLGYTW